MQGVLKSQSNVPPGPLIGQILVVENGKLYATSPESRSDILPAVLTEYWVVLQDFDVFSKKNPLRYFL